MDCLQQSIVIDMVIVNFMFVMVIMVMMVILVIMVIMVMMATWLCGYYAYMVIWFLGLL
jgi:hypothetical protein